MHGCGRGGGPGRKILDVHDKSQRPLAVDLAHEVPESQAQFDIDTGVTITLDAGVNANINGGDGGRFLSQVVELLADIRRLSL